MLEQIEEVNLLVDVSIIIVNWNVMDLLDACLASIDNGHIAIQSPQADKPTVEVIVVDSASSDNSVTMIQEQYPWVKLLAQTENVGFTRGNNLGLEQAQGRYLFLLNPDTEIVEYAIPQMLQYLEANPKVGILGPHTLNTDKTTQSSKRRFPTFTTALFESTWLQLFAPSSLMVSYYAEDIADDSIAEVDWVQGSAMMIRHEVYEQIGGLDTDFIMYSEELDYCKRAKDNGWDVIYFGEAQIIHHGGKSSEQATARKHILFNQSKIHYFRKHHGPVQAQILRLFLLINYGWQLLIEYLKSLVGHKRSMRKERIKTYWQVLRTGLKAN